MRRFWLEVRNARIREEMPRPSVDVQLGSFDLLLQVLHLGEVSPVMPVTECLLARSLSRSTARYGFEFLRVRSVQVFVLRSYAHVSSLSTLLGSSPPKRTTLSDSAS